MLHRKKKEKQYFRNTTVKQQMWHQLEKKEILSQTKLYARPPVSTLFTYSRFAAIFSHAKENQTGE